MPTVYKKNGKPLEVNDHMLQYLDELGLTEKPVLSRKTPKKAKKA